MHHLLKVTGLTYSCNYSVYLFIRFHCSLEPRLPIRLSHYEATSLSCYSFIEWLTALWAFAHNWLFLIYQYSPSPTISLYFPNAKWLATVLHQLNKNCFLPILTQFTPAKYLQPIETKILHHSICESPFLSDSYLGLPLSLCQAPSGTFFFCNKIIYFQVHKQSFFYGFLRAQVGNHMIHQQLRKLNLFYQ